MYPVNALKIFPPEVWFCCSSRVTMDLLAASLINALQFRTSAKHLCAERGHRSSSEAHKEMFFFFTFKFLITM
ncbi:hypothetical protein ILYODFUR_003643 [Ilyodon furcidens]|uniref:Uncharacterized protein n=1 Tax=Ilyodon furcidens TaxID=33524 RepID=A0ABV0SL53_9TELE